MTEQALLLRHKRVLKQRRTRHTRVRKLEVIYSLFKTTCLTSMHYTDKTEI